MSVSERYPVQRPLALARGLQDITADALAAGLTTGDLQEIVDAAADKLTPCTYDAERILADVARSAHEAVGLGVARNRGHLILRAPRMIDARWTAEPVHEEPGVVVVPVPVPTNALGYDERRDYYQPIIEAALTAHVAVFGPWQAEIEYGAVGLPGATLEALQERIDAAWAPYRDKLRAVGLPDDCPDCGNTIDRDAMCERCASQSAAADAIMAVIA